MTSRHSAKAHLRWRAITKCQPMLLYLLPHKHPMFVSTIAESGCREARCRQLVCICEAEAKRAQLRAPPWQGGTCSWLITLIRPEVAC